MPGFGIAIIDGTGDWNDGDYAVNMATSFCSQLRHRFSASAQYERGPSLEGYRIRERGVRAARFLIQARKNGAEQLFLAGYSRGGSSCVYAAEILRDAKLDVDGLFLFDPVARHLTSGGEGIPANVKVSRVALRSLDPVIVRKYEGTIDGGLGNPMRPSFGSMAVLPAGQGKHDMRYFIGSHGALGGVGWTHVREDPACQKSVANYMNEGFAEFGLKSNLSDMGVFAKP